MGLHVFVWVTGPELLLLQIEIAIAIGIGVAIVLLASVDGVSLANTIAMFNGIDWLARNHWSRAARWMPLSASDLA